MDFSTTNGRLALIVTFAWLKSSGSRVATIGLSIDILLGEHYLISSRMKYPAGNNDSHKMGKRNLMSEITT